MCVLSRTQLRLYFGWSVWGSDFFHLLVSPWSVNLLLGWIAYVQVCVHGGVYDGPQVSDPMLLQAGVPLDCFPLVMTNDILLVLGVVNFDFIHVTNGSTTFRQYSVEWSPHDLRFVKCITLFITGTYHETISVLIGLELGFNRSPSGMRVDRDKQSVFWISLHEICRCRFAQFLQLRCFRIVLLHAISSMNEITLRNGGQLLEATAASYCIVRIKTIATYVSIVTLNRVSRATRDTARSIPVYF